MRSVSLKLLELNECSFDLSLSDLGDIEPVMWFCCTVLVVIGDEFLNDEYVLAGNGDDVFDEDLEDDDAVVVAVDACVLDSFFSMSARLISFCCCSCC